jgi:hypothetical protein
VGAEEFGMTDKNVSNVSIRAPENIRRALELRRVANQKRSLTMVVEDTIQTQKASIKRLRIKRAPGGAPRLTLSIRTDLAESLKSVADDRCVSIGDLLFSLLDQDLAKEIQTLSTRRPASSDLSGLATAA